VVSYLFAIKEITDSLTSGSTPSPGINFAAAFTFSRNLNPSTENVAGVSSKKTPETRKFFIFETLSHPA